MQPELATTQADQGLMAAASALAHRLRLPTTLVKFLIVGGIGFCVNQSFLFLFYDSPVFWFFPAKDTNADLLHPDLRLLISSILAVEIAIISQFSLHEAWTFRKRERRGLALTRFLKFNLSSIVSPIIIVLTINILTPIVRNASGEDSPLDVLAPYISNGIGVLLGLTWNWTLNTLVIWPRTITAEPFLSDAGKIDDHTPVAVVGADWSSLFRQGLRYVRRQYASHRTIARFALVGSFGYLIYSGVLFLLYDLHALPFLPAKEREVELLLLSYNDSLLLITTLIGTEASIAGVFVGHSLWTFADLPVAKKALGLRFLEFQLKALVPTLGILTVVVNGLAVGFGIHHTLAVPIGFAASFMWNWLWDSRIIWRKNGSAGQRLTD